MLKKVCMIMGVLCISCVDNEMHQKKTDTQKAFDDKKNTQGNPVEHNKADKINSFDSVNHSIVLDHPTKNIRVYCDHRENRSSCFFEGIIHERYIKHEISAVENANLFRITNKPSHIERAKTFPVQWSVVTDTSAMIDIKTEAFLSGKKHTTRTLLLIDFELGMIDR